jgi:hypothetical protein
MKRLAIAVLVLLAITLAACGGGDKSTEDANDVPRCVTVQQKANGNCAVTDAPRTLGMPNTFPNIATECDGFGHRLYTTTDRVLYVIADPSCPGYTDRTPMMGVVPTAPQG